MNQKQIIHQRVQGSKPTQQMLWVAKEMVENSNSYPVEEQQKDAFHRGLLRAVSIGNVLLFKELMVANESLHYDFKQLYQQRDIIYIQYSNLSILHCACFNGRASMISYLINNGFADDINKTDNKYESSAFYLAVQSFLINDKQKPDCLVEMLNKGANPLIKNGQGKSLRDLIRISQLDNDLTKWVLDIYRQYERAQAIKLGAFVMIYSSKAKIHPLFNKLSIFDKEEIVSIL